MAEHFFCDNSVTLKINLFNIGASAFVSGKWGMKYRVVLQGAEEIN